MSIRNYLGFDRKLKLEWLDATAALAGKSAGAAKAQLNTFLAKEISGKDARRKTNDALRRLWIICEDNVLTRNARKLFNGAERDARICLHYGMSLMAAPLFRDAVYLVGRLISLQGKVSVAQVRTRIYETWGERSTLDSAVSRIFGSLADWGILKPLGKGHYETITITVQDSEIASWLLAAAVSAHPSNQLPVEELPALSALFPFEINDTSQLVRMSGYFERHREGLDRTYVRVRT
jgi:hypothetical protein